jgi:hypothetical protein
MAKKFKYITVDLRNMKGVKKAEKLKNNGWNIISNSIDTLIFEKRR